MAKNHDKAIQVGGGLIGGGLVRGGWEGGSLIRGDFGSGSPVRRGLAAGSLAETLDTLATGNLDKDLSQMKAFIDRMAKADPKDVQEVAASQLHLLTGHYKIALSQSRRCLFWALFAAGIGVAFFVLAVFCGIIASNAVAAVIPFLAGLVMEAAAGLLFRSYGRTAAEASGFHQSLEDVQRHLLANSICEGLTGERREQTRADLVRRIANIQTASFLATPPRQATEGGQS